jgi:hypothetical protein
MKNKLINIIGFGIEPERAELMALQIMGAYKNEYILIPIENKTIESNKKSLKYKISCKNEAIKKLSRWDKNGSHKEAILRIMDQKDLLIKELKKLEKNEK